MSSLLSEFPEHTYEQWHAAAVALLKGASFEQKLVSKTYEDITIQPIYLRSDIQNLEHRKHFPGSGTLVRGSQAQGYLKTAWEYSQEIRAKDVNELNALVHEGLNGGQSELNVLVGCGVGECCRGVSLNHVADVKAGLDGVAVDAISTYWQTGVGSLPVAALVLAAAEEMGVKPEQLRGGFENDPIAELLVKGSLRQSLDVRFEHMAAMTDYAGKHAKGLRTITIKGDVYHNAGASATQELGYVLATLVTYIEEMKSRGIEPAAVFPHVRIRLAVGSDYFMEIAKIRAARWLWSKVAAAYGVENPPIHIHASTSRWNKTTYDAHTNMLRVTSEAFAAVVAGVDSLHIGPYDEISGSTDEFSRRIARNLHTILSEECGLDKVIDPSGGSTYIEWLTDKVAAKSWEIFQGVESTGGMLTNVQNGSVQKAVKAVADAKFKNIRRRKDRIVGANMYPDLKGGKLNMIVRECKAATGGACTCMPEPANVNRSATASMMIEAIAAAKAGASRKAIAMATGLACMEGGLEVEALPQRRSAEEYEALRDASAAYAASTGSAPSILQLNIGPSRKYRMRADWTAAFFEAAGFQVDGARDFKDIEEAVAALKESAATIAVITSDDATYLESVVPLATATKAAKDGVYVLVAGAPGDNEAAWRDAGVDEFVNVKSNNYELNLQLLQRVGVTIA